MLISVRDDTNDVFVCGIFVSNGMVGRVLKESNRQPDLTRGSCRMNKDIQPESYMQYSQRCIHIGSRRNLCSLAAALLLPDVLGR